MYAFLKKLIHSELYLQPSDMLSTPLILNYVNKNWFNLLIILFPKDMSFLLFIFQLVSKTCSSISLFMKVSLYV